MHKPLLTRWIFWLTLSYLLCELAFSAHLLDVCSQEATLDDIHDVERVGRFLTGVALALFVIGAFIDRDTLQPVKRAFFAALAIMVCWCVSYMGQDSAVTHLVEHQFQGSTDRKDAYLLTLAGHSLANGTLNIRSIQTDDILAHPASVKAFVAIFPALAFSYPDIHTEINSVLKKAIELNVRKPCPADYDFHHCFGSAEQFYNHTWPGIVNSVEKQYAAYVDGYNRTVSATTPRRLAAEADNAWADYDRDLRRRHTSPQTVPSRYYGQVRHNVRQRGIPVPDNWDPADRQTFSSLLQRKIYNNTWQAFNKRMGLADTRNALSIQQFMLLRPVQTRIKADLGIDEPGLQLPLATDFASFTHQVYTPLSNVLIKRKQADTDAYAGKFVTDPALTEKGRTAAQTMVVVPMALLFSLLGGLGHLCKLLTISMNAGLRRLSAGRQFGRALPLVGFGLSMSLVSLLTTLLYHTNNALVNAAVFKELASYVAVRNGELLRIGLEFIIRLQEHVYPLNAWLLGHPIPVASAVVAAILLVFLRQKRRGTVSVRALQPV